MHLLYRSSNLTTTIVKMASYSQLHHTRLKLQLCSCILIILHVTSKTFAASYFQLELKERKNNCKPHKMEVCMSYPQYSVWVLIIFTVCQLYVIMKPIVYYCNVSNINISSAHALLQTVQLGTITDRYMYIIHSQVLGSQLVATLCV